ncbi:hypothetical protein F7C95_19810 [Opitutia bacterium ISCC 51]|nr:hypothetical protein F7C95_19810 [Opitutae bacterium ISCC 51]QXD28197.1 hypothetical protein GA003_19715 [Opitutae bacterium ISCC 52]
MTTIIVTLIIVSFILFFMEVFAPGGVLGFFGACALIAAAVLAYDTMGLFGSISILVGGTLAAIALFFIQIKLLAKSRFGRTIQHKDQQRAQTSPVGRNNLIGKTGIALTTMAPSGRVKIANETFEAASNSGLIDKNATVEVVRSEHLKLIVREI